MNKLLPEAQNISNYILSIRGKKVMLDVDLAILYDVRTKRLNEQVKRNNDRFPIDFMFQLTDDEKREVVANCDHLEKLKFAKTNPYAFTEHGTIMLASVLHSRTAIETSVLIVRAFVNINAILLNHKELDKKLRALESKYNQQFKVVFQAIKKLMQQAPLKNQSPRKKIGY